MKERQHVHSAERSLQRAGEQLLQVSQLPAGHAIDVSDQLRL